MGAAGHSETDFSFHVSDCASGSGNSDKFYVQGIY